MEYINNGSGSLSTTCTKSATLINSESYNEKTEAEVIPKHNKESDHHL